MKSFAAIAIVLIFLTQSHGVEPKEPQDAWVVYVQDGQSLTRQADLLPATTPLENYRPNLLLICPDMVARNEAEEDAGDGPFPNQIRTLTHPFATECLTSIKLGPWYDYLVFNVENVDARHRSIVLRDRSGNHRILYTQAMHTSMNMAERPYILEVAGHQVLAYRAHPGGTGNFYVEYYFLFDPKTRLPKPLDLQPIEAKLAEILPAGHAVWKGGGFDIASLTYTHFVWQEGDGNCCPSGGSVSMKLAIRDLALVVVDAVYSPQSIQDEDGR